MKTALLWLSVAVLSVFIAGPIGPPLVLLIWMVVRLTPKS